MTTKPAKPVLCHAQIRPAGSTASLPSLVRIISRRYRPAILGGNDAVKKYSIFCAEPMDSFQFQDGQNEPFEQLQSCLEKYKLADDGLAHFDLPLPGWIGFFTYPLAHHIEKLPRLAKDDVPWPLICLAFYDKAVIYDHQKDTYSFIVLDYPGQRQTSDEKFHRLQSWLDEAAAGSGLCVCPENIAQLPAGCGGLPLQLTTNMTREYYFDALMKIRRHILDGDVYQINFSQRFECDFAADPADYFLWQNRYNPAPYAAYLSTEDFSVVSASPELFLRIEGDGILTRPIKGTRPRRIGDNSFNRRQFEELAASAKDQAELMMIVDLERNDLARVCKPGTRHVSCLRTIEAYPTLFHAYAEVAGTLPAANNATMVCEILRAVFPGGSITGAPKIRAMEIIEQLEPTCRGLYTGCIGHIGVDFRMTLNIAIRTAVFCNQKAYVQTGGGIVADSDPQAEWDEMKLKADALLAGLNAVHVGQASCLGA